MTAEELLADLARRDAVVAAAASEGYGAGWLDAVDLAVLSCGLREGRELALAYVAECEARGPIDRSWLAAMFGDYELSPGPSSSGGSSSSVPPSWVPPLVIGRGA